MSKQLGRTGLGLGGVRERLLVPAALLSFLQQVHHNWGQVLASSQICSIRVAGATRTMLCADQLGKD